MICRLTGNTMQGACHNAVLTARRETSLSASSHPTEDADVPSPSQTQLHRYGMQHAGRMALEQQCSTIMTVSSRHSQSGTLTKLQAGSVTIIVLGKGDSISSIANHGCVLKAM